MGGQLAHDGQAGRIGERREETNVGVGGLRHGARLSTIFYIDNAQYKCQDLPVDPLTHTPRHPMSPVRDPSDVVNQERRQAFSPSEEKRRSAARLLAALRCCTQASWGSRLRATLTGRQTACCATG
jgi:hypothetical protein